MYTGLHPFVNSLHIVREFVPPRPVVVAWTMMGAGSILAGCVANAHENQPRHYRASIIDDERVADSVYCLRKASGNFSGGASMTSRLRSVGRVKCRTYSRLWRKAKL